MIAKSLRAIAVGLVCVAILGMFLLFVTAAYISLVMIGSFICLLITGVPQ